jgi:hypothetical protein
MPRFSDYFHLGLSQHELDFVDVSNERDTPVVSHRFGCI